MAGSDQKVDSDLSSINSTMAIENVTLDEEQIARCRSILSDAALPTKTNWQNLRI